MTDIATIGIKAETSDLRRGEQALDRFAAQGERTERRVSGAARTMTRALTSVTGTIVAALSVQSISMAADQYTQMTNGLRVLGLTADQAAQRLDQIAQIAARTRAPLAATAQLYQRISVAAGELGASQRDVLRFTENVGLALAQQGGSAAAASGALLQLSQAIAGGTVRAEEFNSILEGAYPIALAAAQGIEAAGGSVARLRQLVIEGRVSSEEFFAAILSQSDALEAAFGDTVPTISSALGQLRDSFTMFIGAVDAATGVTSVIASGILFLANNLENAAGFIISTAVAVTAYYLPAVTAAIAQTAVWVAGLITLRGALIATGIGAFIVAGGMLVNLLLRLVENTGSWGEALAILGRVASGVWEGIVSTAQAIPSGLSAVWHSLKADFIALTRDLILAWSRFLQSLSESVPEIELFDGIRGSIEDARFSALQTASDLVSAFTQARFAARDAQSAWNDRAGFSGAADAIAELREVLAGVNEETVNTEEEVAALLRSLREAGSGGAAALRETEDAARDLAEAMKPVESSFESAFVDFVTGAKSAQDAIGSLLRDLARLAAQAAFRSLFGRFFGGGGGFLGTIFGGARSFEGGGFTGSGPRSGGLDGRGGFLAMVHPNETVVDHTKGGGASQVVLRLEMSRDVEARVMQSAQNVAVQIVRENNRMVVPDIARNAIQDRRARG